MSSGPQSSGVGDAEKVGEEGSGVGDEDKIGEKSACGLDEADIVSGNRW